MIPYLVVRFRERVCKTSNQYCIRARLMLNGLVALGQNGISGEMTKSPGILPAPRIGFAYDLTGRHDIVFRAGGGVFYDRERTDAYMSSGINDWDMSLQKNLPIKERAHLRVASKLRVEAFNIFNHTQFSGVNNTLNFSGLKNPQPSNLPYNSAGQLVNISGFGTVNGVDPPRVLQFVAKSVF
jgi:hypothetical protein